MEKCSAFETIFIRSNTGGSKIFKKNFPSSGNVGKFSFINSCEKGHNQFNFTFFLRPEVSPEQRRNLYLNFDLI